MKSLLVTDKRNAVNFNSLTFGERLGQLDDIEQKDKERRERERNSPFNRWTQFNNERTKELMWLAINYPKAHAILYFLIDQMDEYNAVMCSYKVLEEVINIKQATIARNIKVLKDNGFIVALKSGTSNVYAINDTFYWKSWGNNKRYSKFPANVVLALSEQENNYQISFEDLGTTKHREVIKKEKTEKPPKFEEYTE
jgi:Fe2+ or Zn2+ uptake regulation protein